MFCSFIEITFSLKDGDYNISKPWNEVISHWLGRNFEKVAEHVPTASSLSEERRLLIGAYFTAEYSVEAAALFTPSGAIFEKTIPLSLFCHNIFTTLQNWYIKESCVLIPEFTSSNTKIFL